MCKVNKLRVRYPNDDVGRNIRDQKRSTALHLNNDTNENALTATNTTMHGDFGYKDFLTSRGKTPTLLAKNEARGVPFVDLELLKTGGHFNEDMY